MKVRSIVVVLLITLVISNAAFAAVDLNVGASFPIVGDLLGEIKTTDVHAGITLLVTTSDTLTGIDRADYQGGYLNLPSNERSKCSNWVKNTCFAKDGLFPEFNFLRVDPLILGIKDRNIVDEYVQSDDPRIKVGPNGIVIDLAGMACGKHYLVYNLVQNASRKDRRILFLRIARHPENTDQQAMIFTIKDPADCIDQLGEIYSRRLSCDGKTLLQMIRAKYLAQEIGSMALIKSEASFEDQAFGAASTPVSAGSSNSASTTTKVVVNFVNASGTAVSYTNIKVSLSGPAQYNCDAQNATANFVGCACGDYNLTFQIWDAQSNSWVQSKSHPVKVFANMQAITVTIR